LQSFRIDIRTLTRTYSPSLSHTHTHTHIQSERNRERDQPKLRPNPHRPCFTVKDDFGNFPISGVGKNLAPTFWEFFPTEKLENKITTIVFEKGRCGVQLSCTHMQNKEREIGRERNRDRQKEEEERERRRGRGLERERARERGRGRRGRKRQRD
jgi:zinc finger CCCH domain-containing protein 13